MKINITPQTKQTTNKSFTLLKTASGNVLWPSVRFIVLRLEKATQYCSTILQELIKVPEAKRPILNHNNPSLNIWLSGNNNKKAQYESWDWIF